MTDVIQTGGGNGSTSVGVVLGIILAIVVGIVLFYFYGLPAIQQKPADQKTEIRVELPALPTPTPTPAPAQ